MFHRTFQILLLLLLITSSYSALRCPPVLQPTAREGYKLTGHVIITYSFLGCRDVCIEACAAHDLCFSVNFYRKKRECELNQGDHKTNPQNITIAVDSEYIDYPLRTFCVGPALGMQSRTILNNQISASSYYGPNTQPLHARLVVATAGWMARFQDLNQWLQVDLLSSTHISAIATQGQTSKLVWVKTYSLQYSDDGVVLTDYKAGHVFQGNTDNGGIVKNDFIPAIVARYIRVLPKSWVVGIVMRIELYGECKA